MSPTNWVAPLLEASNCEFPKPGPPLIPATGQESESRGSNCSRKAGLLNMYRTVRNRSVLPPPDLPDRRHTQRGRPWRRSSKEHCWRGQMPTLPAGLSRRLRDLHGKRQNRHDAARSFKTPKDFRDGLFARRAGWQGVRRPPARDGRSSIARPATYGRPRTRAIDCPICEARRKPWCRTPVGRHTVRMATEKIAPEQPDILQTESRSVNADGGQNVCRQRGLSMAQPLSRRVPPNVVDNHWPGISQTCDRATERATHATFRMVKMFWLNGQVSPDQTAGCDREERRG